MSSFTLALAGTVERHARAITAAFVAAAAMAIVLAAPSIGHDYEDWIDHDGAHFRAYTALRETFGDSDTVLAAFARAQLNADNYAPYIELLERLAAMPGVVAVLDPVRDLLGADATYPPSEEDILILRDALRGHPDDYRSVLVAQDVETFGVLVLLDPRRRAAHSDIVDTLRSGLAALRIDPMLAGTAYFSATLADTISRDLGRVMSVLALAAAILLYVFLRNVRLVACILAGIGVSMLFALSITSACGLAINLLSLLLVPLVISIGLSTAAHLFTRRRGSDWDYAYALAHVFQPAAYAALTTAIGCLAFYFAPQVIISRMGVVMPLAVLATFITMLVFVPAALHSVAAQTQLPRLPHPGWLPSARARRPVAILILVLATVAAVTLPALRTEPDALAFFADDSPLVQAYRQIEQRLAGLLVADLVISSNDGTSMRSATHARAVHDFITTLRRLSELTTAISVYDFAWLESREGVKAPGLHATLISADEHQVRVVLHLRNVDGRPWRTIAQDIDAAWTAAAHANLSMQLSGLIPLILEAQDHLLQIQSRMLPVVVAVICAVLLLLLGQLRLLGPAIVANFLPLLITGGAMVWFGMALNSINLFVASVMLGIVVDDTVHILCAWRACGTVEGALREVRDGLWVSSLTVGLAFSALAISELVPIRQFGLLAVIAVSSAWLCDVCVLPQLLRREPAPA